MPLPVSFLEVVKLVLPRSVLLPPNGQREKQSMKRLKRQKAKESKRGKREREKQMTRRISKRIKGKRKSQGENRQEEMKRMQWTDRQTCLLCLQ